MKKILPVILNEVLKPVAANLLRFLANKLAGRKKKSDNCEPVAPDNAVTAGSVATD